MTLSYKLPPFTEWLRYFAYFIGCLKLPSSSAPFLDHHVTDQIQVI